jgi:phosphatidylserine decarboxylase
LSQTSQQHRRFHLRKQKRREETNDTSATASDADQAEICIQYGLAYKNDQDVTLPINPLSMEEDWQYLLNEENLLADISLVSTSPQLSQPQPMMQESASSSTFSSRFKRNSSQQQLKKDNSMSSIQSLTTTPSKTTTRRRRLRNRFGRRRRQPAGEGYAKFYSDIMGITFLEIESAKDLWYIYFSY